MKRRKTTKSYITAGQRLRYEIETGWLGISLLLACGVGLFIFGMFCGWMTGTI
jgi:hypothetical protein